MNKDLFEGKWNQVKGKVKEKWGKLTDNDLTTINGKRDQLVGKLQERYGYQKEQAERELRELEGRLCDSGSCGHESHEGRREEAFSGANTKGQGRSQETGRPNQGQQGHRHKDDR